MRGRPDGKGASLVSMLAQFRGSKTDPMYIVRAHVECACKQGLESGRIPQRENDRLPDEIPEERTPRVRILILRLYSRRIMEMGAVRR